MPSNFSVEKLSLFYRIPSELILFFQHLHTVEKDGQVLNYFVSGAANFVDTSNEHIDNVPNGSSKFFWAKIAEFGGFGYVEVTASNMTFTFVNGDEQPLYKYVLDPR